MYQAGSFCGVVSECLPARELFFKLLIVFEIANRLFQAVARELFEQLVPYTSRIKQVGMWINSSWTCTDIYVVEEAN